MKNATLFFVFAIVAHLAIAQVDTVCRYPYLYFYNWPENVLFTANSANCNLSFASNGPYCDNEEHQYWQGQLDGTSRRITEMALYQHTDGPMDIIGIAVSNCTGMQGSASIVSLYDSNLNELSSFFWDTRWWVSSALASDTTAYCFYYPGYTYSCSPNTYFFFIPFGKTVTISGDFYIGLRDTDSFYTIPQAHFMSEYHNPPYHFPNISGYRLKIDSTWSDLRTQRSIALLLPIIDPPCNAVDSMDVEVGADGCLRVSWEKPRLQSQWMVSLVADGGGEILQPTDTNYWEYCNLTPGRRYTVRLRSRCDNLYSHSWSDWGEPVSFGENHGIEAVTEPAVSVVPNPAADRVAVRCGGRMTAVEVVDALGRTVLSIDGGGNEATLDVSALPTGLYTVLVTTPQGRSARHLTIAR